MPARLSSVRFVIAAAVAAMPGAPLRGAQALSCAASEARVAEVAEVIAGDLLRLDDGSLVQLTGIEVVQPAAGGPRFAQLADAALRVAREIVAGGPVTLSGVSPPDRYNRVHAMVYSSDGYPLQEAILGEGLARVRFLPGEALCGEDLLAAEEAGRKAGAGLWSSHEYAIRNADDPSLSGQTGLYGLVEGRVVSVSAGSRIVFIDFGRNWRRDFTVMVAAAQSGRFAAAGKKLESLIRRHVRVRGVLEESNGPAMRIADPAAIEILDDDAQ